MFHAALYLSHACIPVRHQLSLTHPFNTETQVLRSKMRRQQLSPVIELSSGWIPKPGGQKICYVLGLTYKGLPHLL